MRYAAGVRAWHYVLDPESQNGWCDKDGHELFEKIAGTVAETLGRAIPHPI